MKKKHNLNDFLSKEISSQKADQIKGGHADIRRPSTTTVTAIWDDLEVRRVKFSVFGGGGRNNSDILGG